MRKSVLLSLVLLAAPVVCAAQSPNQSPATSSHADWARVQQLPPGTHVSVNTATGKHPCSVSAVDSSSITCAHAGKTETYPQADIRSVHRSHRSRSTAVGFVVGAGAGAGIGAASVGKGDRSLAALVFGVGAAIVGTLIGLATDFTGGTIYKAP